jgi:trehalose-6-phosphate synthase
MTYYFSPLLDRISLKRVYWDEAFKELNNAILTYAFGISEYRTRPVFESVLISDEETKINNTIRLLQNRLISHRDAIDEIRGIENSEEKFAEIVAEYKELEKVAGFLNIKISATPALPVAE